MIIFLTDIPDYDEELERLAHASSFDFSGSIARFLDRLFDFHIDPLVFEVLKYLAYIIVGVLVVWYIYKEFMLGDFVFPETHSTVVPRHILGTAADADIRGHDFDAELTEALRREDYAEAVRLRYLYTLQQLNTMKVIEWKEWKTPLMYVDETGGNAGVLRELTKTFLYIKYGHYPATRETYDTACTLGSRLTTVTEGGAA